MNIEMNRDSLTDSIFDLVQYLRRLAAEDEELAQRLKSLGQALLEEMPLSEVSTSDEANRSLQTGGAPMESPALEVQHSSTGSPPKSKRKWVPVANLTLGRSSSSDEGQIELPTGYRVAHADPDLVVLEKRLRLKAEGGRWAAARRRQLASGRDFVIDIEPRDRDIIARARKLPECYLWMCHPTGPEPDDWNLFELCGNCYEVAADAVALTRKVLDESEVSDDMLEPAMALTAEAQSALRTILRTIDAPTDPDQIAIYDWLRSLTAQHQIVISRYMRANDAADPTRHLDLSERIEQLSTQFESALGTIRLRRKRMGKVRHKCSVISTELDTPDSEWQILATAVHELIQDGLPPSNRELRELLLPVHDLRPGDLTWPSGFERVLAEIDRYLSLNPQVDETRSPTFAPEVAQVRELVQGRSMFLIGGQRRPHSAEAIRHAFGLKELVWFTTEEHSPLSTFEPSIAREDVAVVLLAIRWSSHSYSDVSQYCERYGKPLVRLPRGYNANQIAVEIMSQCSERLERHQV